METNRIIVESNIPFIKGLLEPYFKQVDYLTSPEIDREAVRDADAILVRTRTKCDSQLLEGSKCTFVGTATIGLDHIDQEWCAENGIEVANAPGCNAPAVAQYVLSSIVELSNRPLSQYTLGIVGVGNVGKIVERWARLLDMRVLLCDPPRQKGEGGDHWCSLDEIAEKSDIITFHPTLNPTSRHMANADFFSKLKRRPIIINAARGPIVDTPSLIDAIDAGKVLHAAVDCWEGEPNINLDLLNRCKIATPHIAGYSFEGKVRATRMVLDSLCRHFGLLHIKMEHEVPAGAVESVSAVGVRESYNPMDDTIALKRSPEKLEELRDNYSLRREAPLCKID